MSFDPFFSCPARPCSESVCRSGFVLYDSAANPSRPVRSDLFFFPRAYFWRTAASWLANLISKPVGAFSRFPLQARALPHLLSGGAVLRGLCFFILYRLEYLDRLQGDHSFFFLFFFHPAMFLWFPDVNPEGYNLTISYFAFPLPGFFKGLLFTFSHPPSQTKRSILLRLPAADVTMNGLSLHPESWP